MHKKPTPMWTYSVVQAKPLNRALYGQKERAPAKITHLEMAAATARAAQLTLIAGKGCVTAPRVRVI